MIKDFRLHGSIGEDYEFFATLCGPDLNNRYFHEPLEKNGALRHRFFLGGNEFTLSPEGVDHTGNGGNFCPYMFGVEQPIEDLAKPDVINRLVLFGARHEGARIAFSEDTRGFEDFRQIFLRGHAIFNYYFFVQFDRKATLRRQQEEILRTMGRNLKRFTLDLGDDDAGVGEHLRSSWGERAPAFFLLKMVHRRHLAYSRKFRELYPTIGPGKAEEAPELVEAASRYGIEPYSQLRMKIDAMYRYPENRQVVEEYRAVLVEVHRRGQVTFDDSARISRLRTVALRKGIPINLLTSLDEKLLGDRKVIETEEAAYLVEVRGVLETIFLRTRKVGVHLEAEDLIRLFKAKLTALERRDTAFDRILIEVGKECDDRSRANNDPSFLEDFGNIVTYFDRFDAVYHMVNGLAFHEEERLPDEKLRSLLANKKVFDGIQENLFHDLFIVPILANPYLPGYGRRKVQALFEGLSTIETGDRSLQDLGIALGDLVREEREYKVVKTAMDRWLKKFGRSLRGIEEEQAFVGDVRKMLTSRSLVRADVPESFFRKTLEDLKLERLYVTSILPKALKTRDPAIRSEFLRTSGIDRIRVEEMERDFAQQYKLSDDVLDQVRTTGT